METSIITQETKKQAELVFGSLDAIVVKNDDDSAKATEFIKGISDAKKKVKAEKDEYVRPAKEIVAKAKEVYDPIIDKLDEAESIVRGRVKTYLVDKEKKRIANEAKIAEAAASGKISEATAVKKLEKVGEANTVSKGGGATLGLRKEKKVVVKDESLVPDEYWVIDMVKLSKVAKAGVTIPGVEVVEDYATQLR